MLWTLIVLLLLFFNGLLADLPNSALAAVVISAALSLADFAVLARVWKVRRSAAPGVPSKETVPSAVTLVQDGAA